VQSQDIIADEATFKAVEGTMQMEAFEPHNISGSSTFLQLYRPLNKTKPNHYKIVSNNLGFRIREEQKMHFINCLYDSKVITCTSGEGTGKSLFLEHSQSVAKKLGFTSYLSYASENFDQAYYTLRTIVKAVLRVERAGWDDLDLSKKLAHISQQIGAVVELCSNENQKEKENSAHEAIGSSLSSVFAVRKSFALDTVLSPSAKMNNSVVESSGTVLESSFKKHNNRKNSFSNQPGWYPGKPRSRSNSVDHDANKDGLFAKKMAIHPVTDPGEASNDDSGGSNSVSMSEGERATKLQWNIIRERSVDAHMACFGPPPNNRCAKKDAPGRTRHRVQF